MGDVPPEKKKILFVEHTAEMAGGGQQSLLVLLQRIDRTRFAPMVVLPEPGKLAGHLDRLAVPYRIIPFGTLRGLDILKAAGVVRRLVRVMREEGVDIVHTNASRSTFYAGLAARCSGIPLVWHVRIASREPVYDRFLYALASRVIAISRAVAGRFPWDRGRKVTVVYNGLDPNLYESGGRAEKRADSGLPGKVVIGLIGRIEPDKGGDKLIRALRKAREDGAGLHLLIVGERTPYRKDLERQAARLGLSGTVTFAGYREDIPGVMSSVDILALPSRTEAFGRVLIEAMACGKPVVAFAVDAVPEIVEDGVTGLLVPFGDVDALADAMRKLADDPALRLRMGEKGRERVREYFSLREHARRVELLYEEILAS